MDLLSPCRVSGRGGWGAIGDALRGRTWWSVADRARPLLCFPLGQRTYSRCSFFLSGRLRQGPRAAALVPTTGT